MESDETADAGGRAHPAYLGKLDIVSSVEGVGMVEATLGWFKNGKLVSSKINSTST